MKDEIRKPDSTLRSTLKSIFRKHEYYGMWGNKHGYRIEDVMSDIVSLISQNSIPKEKAGVEELEKIITAEINKFYVKPSGAVLPITNIAQAIYNYLKEKE